MADTKGTSLTTGTTLHSTDLLLGVDTTDTTMAGSGTTKRFSPAVVAAGLPAAGSTGQLTYNNAGAFAGAADWAIGSSGQLTGTAISDPGSPAAGDVWISSGQKTLSGVSSGCIARLGGCIWVANGPGTALTNTTTETSLLSGIASSEGSLVIPANSLVAGKIIRFVWFASMNITTTGLITLNHYLGATKVLSGGATSVIAANTGLTLVTIQNVIMVQAAGASGKVLGSAITTVYSSTLTGTASYYQPSGGTTIAQVTVDTTASLTVDLKAKWNETSTSDSIRLMGAALFIDG